MFSLMNLLKQKYKNTDLHKCNKTVTIRFASLIQDSKNLNKHKHKKIVLTNESNKTEE
jgi:hypothetical protein